MDEVAHRELISETIHSTEQCANNRSEHSHEATRVRELGYRADLYSLALALATNNFSEVLKTTWLKHLQLSLVSVNKLCSN